MDMMEDIHQGIASDGLINILKINNYLFSIYILNRVTKGWKISGNFEGLGNIGNFREFLIWRPVCF